MWVRVEEVTQTSRLFTFHSQGSSGIEAYLIENTLFYRILAPDYSEPFAGSNGVRI